MSVPDHLNPAGAADPAVGPPAGAPAHPDPHHEHRWLILGVVLVAQIMILLDSTVVNVALPSAQRALGFSDPTREWIITAYVLAFGSLLPLGGRLADLFGRKRMFLIGLAGFAAASAAGGAAPNVGTLIGARAFQGGFAAALAPAALSLIAVTFTDLKELNKAYGIFGAVSGSAGALGLLLGGVLTDYVDWRWCMYVNIAFAAAGIAGGLALLTNSRTPDRPRLSVPGTLLGSAGLFGLVFGSARAETDGWGATVTITSLAAGALLLVAFAIFQKYDSYPLVPLHVVGDRNRGAAYLAQALGYFALFAVFLFLTYYFQGVLGYSPVKTGLAFLPLPIAIGFAATTTQGRLLEHLSMRGIVATGLTVSAIGSVLLAQAGATSGYASWVLPGLVLVGAGIGSALVVSIAIGQQGVAPEDAGTAGAINNVSQQIGSAIGVALISTFAATATSRYLHHHPAGPATTVRATVHGFAVGYWWAAAVFFAAAVICGALIRPRTFMHDTAAIPQLDDPTTTKVQAAPSLERGTEPLEGRTSSG
ncbi:MFS transporter [Actinomadura sp. NTSP31]|uniref:MFS transporter n=1 Tax=Actinomadura sp. NTSP31 TaxID=1735447 RepID=UPI0035C047DC